MKKSVWLATFAFGWLGFLTVYLFMLGLASFGSGPGVAILVLIATYPIALPGTSSPSSIARGPMVPHLFPDIVGSGGCGDSFSLPLVPLF